MKVVPGVGFVQDVPDGDDREMFRASHNCVCETCGKEYGKHPFASRPVSGIDGLPFLRVLCSGKLVKL